MNIATDQPAPKEAWIVQSRDEAEILVNEIASLDASLNARVALLNRQLLAVRENHEEAIKRIRTTVNGMVDALEVWASQHRHEEFGEKESIDFRRGRIGFRLGQRCVKFLDGWNEELVLKTLRLMRGRWAKFYIRKKEELDRQCILRDTRPEAERLSEADLAGFGIEVKREYKFYVAPKLEPDAI